jgi:hypothetical protein
LPNKALIDVARWIPRGIDAFLNLAVCFQVGIDQDGKDSGLDENEQVTEYLRKM